MPYYSYNRKERKECISASEITISDLIVMYHIIILAPITSSLTHAKDEYL